MGTSAWLKSNRTNGSPFAQAIFQFIVRIIHSLFALPVYQMSSAVPLPENRQKFKNMRCDNYAMAWCPSMIFRVLNYVSLLVRYLCNNIYMPTSLFIENPSENLHKYFNCNSTAQISNSLCSPNSRLPFGMYLCPKYIYFIENVFGKCVCDENNNNSKSEEIDSSCKNEDEQNIDLVNVFSNFVVGDNINYEIDQEERITENILEDEIPELLEPEEDEDEDEEEYDTDIEDIEDTTLECNKFKTNSTNKKLSKLESLIGEPLEEGDQVFMWDESMTENDQMDVLVYKPVHKRIKPVPATFPQEASVTRCIPEDPLLSLPELTKTPPEFIPTKRLTLERLKSMKINEEKFMLPEEEKLFQEVFRLNDQTLAFELSERGISVKNTSLHT